MNKDVEIDVLAFVENSDSVREAPLRFVVCFQFAPSDFPFHFCPVINLLVTVCCRFKR